MEQSNNRFFVLVHRLYSGSTVKKGGADYIVGYLVTRGHVPIYIEHPLNAGGSTLIRHPESSVKETKLFGSGPIRWFQEIIFNISEIQKEKDIKYVLAVDPLNFLGAFLTKLFLKKKCRLPKRNSLQKQPTLFFWNSFICHSWNLD